ncbi:hypothetical protein ANO11243_004890 [Dothideomycetidae sp. 11243]|nr:hypothetical protein ANO11243_004890 [fungal sp. No.11243]
MADSVDRVFGHALNTINKIRHRSARPPVADQLALYGLYKQAMEGDVSTLFPRPDGTSASARKETEKYDAWDANRGLTRTEAKKRYIEKLIATMHVYASGTPEARELVSELEFVWDQVKGNVTSDDGSGDSPSRRPPGGESSYDDTDRPRRRGKDDTPGMRVLSPVSQPMGDEEEEEGREEFVDAPVSQFGEQTEDKSTGGDEERPAKPRRSSAVDIRWRRRVETAIVKMTTEVAALRELVENRRFTAQRRSVSFLNWIYSFGWFAVKLVVADVLVLWLIILYLRRRKDRRLEGAIRVMLGDAQAVAKNLATSVQNKLPHRK